MAIRYLMIAGFLLLQTGMTARADETAGSATDDYGAVRGRQVLKSIELPASRSFWRGGVDALGKQVQIDRTKQETLQFWFFCPTSETAKTSDGFPLLLFLHGAGERGSNPEVVKMHGPPKMLETSRAQDWPFITVSPQCPAGKYWSPEQLLLLLDEVEKRCPVDRSRVYVTGLSMGGYATWSLLNLAPDRFAAAAPVCGGGTPEWAPQIAKTPVWAHHGGADGVVPVKNSTTMVEAVNALDDVKNGKLPKAKLSIYPGVGHNSWDNAYSDDSLWTWFLAHRKPQSK